MRYRYLSLLLPSCVLAFFISPAWGQENATPEISFRCQSDRDVPLTVAQNKAGQTENIFVWQKDILEGKTTESPQQLCHDVARRLNEYHNESGDEANSSLFYLFAQQYNDIPIICVGFNMFCSRVLFTLKRDDEDAKISDRVLDNTVAPNIKENNLRNIRGSSFTGYKVDLFSEEF